MSEGTEKAEAPSLGEEMTRSWSGQHLGRRPQWAEFLNLCLSGCGCTAPWTGAQCLLGSACFKSPPLDGHSYPWHLQCAGSVTQALSQGKATTLWALVSFLLCH